MTIKDKKKGRIDEEEGRKSVRGTREKKETIRNTFSNFRYDKLHDYQRQFASISSLRTIHTVFDTLY